MKPKDYTLEALAYQQILALVEPAYSLLEQKHMAVARACTAQGLHHQHQVREGCQVLEVAGVQQRGCHGQQGLQDDQHSGLPNGGLVLDNVGHQLLQQEVVLSHHSLPTTPAAYQRDLGGRGGGEQGAC